MIKIDFSIPTDYGMYKDAIYLEENHNLTEQEINQLKLDRVNSWIALVTTSIQESSTSIDPVPEEGTAGDQPL